MKKRANMYLAACVVFVMSQAGAQPVKPRSTEFDGLFARRTASSSHERQDWCFDQWSAAWMEVHLARDRGADAYNDLAERTSIFTDLAARKRITQQQADDTIAVIRAVHKSKRLDDEVAEDLISACERLVRIAQH